MQIYVSFYTFSNKEQIFFGSADYFGGADSSGVSDVSDEFSQESFYIAKKSPARMSAISLVIRVWS